MSEVKIGFIGLGLMGSAMVECLQKAGKDLVILGNTSRANIDAAIARGATEVSTARELATICDVIMLCMGTSDHVESRVYGDDGIIAGLRKDAVVIDFGTSLPASSKKIAADMSAAGGVFLDAPLGRTPAHAVDGLLNIMASGDKAGFDRVKPLLDTLGENVFHLGAVGSGHSIKLINNFFGMSVATAWAEAMAMADSAGLDRQQVYDVVSAGPLHSGMMDFVSAYALKDDPTKLEFSIRNALKDVGYYRQMAKDAEFDTLISKGPFTALSEATEKGDGDRMVSEIVDYFKSRQGA